MPRKCLLKAEKRVRVTDETFSKWRLQRDSLGFQYDDEYAQYLLRVGESLQKMNMLDQKEGGPTSADVDVESSRTEVEPQDLNSPTELDTDMAQSGDEEKSDNDNPGAPGVTQTSIKAFKQTLAPPKEAKNNDSDYSARKLDLGWCTAEYDRQQVLSGIMDQKRFIAHLLNSHNQWCSTCRTSSATLTASNLAQDKSEFTASIPELNIPTSWESKKWFEDLNAHSNMSITSFLLHLLLIYSHWHSIPLPGQNKPVKTNNPTDDTVTMVTREVASTSESIQSYSMFIESGNSRCRTNIADSRHLISAKSDFIVHESPEAAQSGMTDANAVPGMTDLSSTQIVETTVLGERVTGTGSIGSAGKNVSSHHSMLSGTNHTGRFDLDVEMKTEQLEAKGDPIHNMGDGFTDLKDFDDNRYLDQGSFGYQMGSFPVPGTDILGIGERQRSSKSRARYKGAKSTVGFEFGEVSDPDDQDDKDWYVTGFDDGTSSCSATDLVDVVPGGEASSQGRKQTDGIDRMDSSVELLGGLKQLDQNGSDVLKSSEMPKRPSGSASEMQIKKEGGLDAVTSIRNEITCTLCLKTFNTQSKHAVHMKWHDKVPTKCTDCDFTIDPEMKTINSSRVAMAIHRKEHHLKIEPVTKCRLCDFTVRVSKLTRMQTHMKIMHGEFMSGASDLIHERGQSMETNMPLDDDLKKTGSKIVAKPNSSGTYDGASFACKICPKHFPTKRKYKQHLGLHMRSYHCQYCDFSLDPDKVNLTDCFVAMSNHRKETHPEHFQKYLCDLCGRGLVTPMSLHDHMVDVHKVPIATAKRQCPNCDAVLASRSALTTHQRRCHPMQLTCDYPGCGKVLSSRSGLSLHKKVVHPAFKRHACTIEGCNAKFPTVMRMKTHIKQKHERQRNFQCDFADCGKRFFSTYNLRVHKRVHLNEKPLKCPRCDYRAAQRNSMNWHMKKHMN
ncbi:uncharacterized protein LOC135497363 isoform X4 [Lineus longissimus]|uniref:uncharacterized protein LOC135497363 isoform X4 n=1 Tax=Lineus longissimus TaxID=88925 RepID=UPI00315D3E5A